ncbi:MAG: HNH endonuclease family protein [Nitrosotalea sp.]
MTDIPIKHLFVEYKFWIEKKRPFATVRDELKTLARQGDAFRRLIEPKSNDPLYPLPNFLNTFDMSTAFPLLLFLLDSEISNDELNKIAVILESYVLRRSVCGFTTQSYNRTFLGLTRFLSENGITSKNVHDYLSSLSGESAEWPTDDKFLQMWQNNHVYAILSRSNRIVYILRRLSDTYLTDKTERISIDGQLTVEHIMPQSWIDNWPLQDGSKGLSWQDTLKMDSEDLRVKSTNQRNSALQTFGNLTILTQPLNSAVSNSAWSVKKPQLLQSSLLPINQQLFSIEVWDEKAIQNRGKELFERAKSIWPSP